MPTYRYRCRACIKEWTESAKISDPPTTVCPECKAPEAERVLGTAQVHLRGGGWARDRYGGKG